MTIDYRGRNYVADYGGPVGGFTLQWSGDDAKDYKHGNDLNLKKAEKELYETMQAGNKFQGSA